MCAQVVLRILKLNLALLLLTFISLLQMKTDCEQLHVEVDPHRVMLQEGQNFTAMCRANYPTKGCTWDKSFTFLNWSCTFNAHGAGCSDGISEIAYEKEKEECRITIHHVTDLFNGNLTCRLYSEDNKLNIENRKETEGNVFLVIVKPPKIVELNVIGSDLLKSEHSIDTFEENQEVTFECKIEFGRPEANISWFIGSELISDSIYNSLSDTVTEDLGSLYDGEKRIRQNLTMYLRKADNGKELKCIANHSALGQGTLLLSVFKLKVYFKIKFGDPEQGAFFVGRSGNVVVTIHANPKPNITWQVDNDTIPEGNIDKTERFHAEYLTNAGQDKWQAVLNITEVRLEDVGKNYSLTAENELEAIQFSPKITACIASVDVAAFSTSSDDVPACLPSSPEVLAYDGDTEQCGFNVGQSGKIAVTIYANPKPNVTWLIDNDTILEGNTDATGRFHAEYLMNAKHDIWQVVLKITEVKAEDVGKHYSLIAENILGKKKYKPVVPACSAPTLNLKPCPALSINFTAWPILAIASAIFLILMVSSILIYLKSDRNWRSDVEIPDFNTYRSFDVVTKGEMENKIRMRKTL